MLRKHRTGRQTTCGSSKTFRSQSCSSFMFGSRVRKVPYLHNSFLSLREKRKFHRPNAQKCWLWKKQQRITNRIKYMMPFDLFIAFPSVHYRTFDASEDVVSAAQHQAFAKLQWMARRKIVSPMRRDCLALFINNKRQSLLVGSKRAPNLHKQTIHSQWHSIKCIWHDQFNKRTQHCVLHYFYSPI